jgi:hypothetical protein
MQLEEPDPPGNLPGNAIIAGKTGISLMTAGRKRITSISIQLGLTRRRRLPKPMLIKAQVITRSNSYWPI